MDSEQHHRTPTKNVKQQQRPQYYQQSPVTFKFLSQQQNSRLIVSTTPQGKFLQSSPCSKPSSIKKINNTNSVGGTTAFNILPVINTPPSRTKQLTKILNPFEAALTDRLHLPLIYSPSLFQRPTTPQHSSTQFEWTIEEVSSLGPANVEPHETQFLGESYDSDVEAKVQAAISSYFKEQQIVPSPINCPLRNQRAVLASETSFSESPFDIKPVKRIRDCYTQTILTLPPILPAELEDALKPYFKYNATQQHSPTVDFQNNDCDNKLKNMSIEYEARDSSLRRKLFGIPSSYDDDTIECPDEIFNCNDFSPPPKTPEILHDLKDSQMILMSHNSDNSIRKISFGSLSPISKLPERSNLPTSITENKNVSEYLVNQEIKPIKKSLAPSSLIKIPVKDPQSLLIQADNALEIITETSINMTAMSTDSLNGCVSRLIIHKNNGSEKEALQEFQQLNSKSKFPTENDIFNQFDGGFDDADGEYDDMQVSQLSVKSVSSNSSGNLTPRRRRKSASRKNLSQSFSFNFSDSEDQDSLSSDLNQIIEKEPLAKRRSPSNIMNKKDMVAFVVKNENLIQNVGNSTTLLNGNSKLNFHRTDSGFNEMSSVNNPDESKLIQFPIIDTENVIGDMEIDSNVTCSMENNTNFYLKNTHSMMDDDDVTNVDASMSSESMICCSTPSKH